MGPLRGLVVARLRTLPVQGVIPARRRGVGRGARAAGGLVDRVAAGERVGGAVWGGVARGAGGGLLAAGEGGRGGGVIVAEVVVVPLPDAAEEGVREELAHTGARVLVRIQAEVNEGPQLLVVDASEGRGFDAVGDLFEDLRRVGALRVGVLHRGELEHAHPEGVHVHLLVVILVV